MKNPIIPLGSESSMGIKDDELGKKNTRPACFGDEAKFVTYMENQATDSEYARCLSEND